MTATGATTDTAGAENLSTNSEKAMADARTYGGRRVADRRLERRERFLEAGLEVFADEGYAASSVTSICRAAGLSRRQFYEIFADREDLLIAVYDEIQDRAQRRVTEALAGGGTHDLHEITATAMRAYMQAIAENPRHAELSFVQIVGVSPRVEQHRLARREVWAQYFLSGMQEFVGPLKDDAVAHYRATAFIGALAAVVYRWSNAEDRAERVDEVADVLAQILLAFARL